MALVLAVTIVILGAVFYMQNKSYRNYKVLTTSEQEDIVANQICQSVGKNPALQQQMRCL